MTSTIQLKEVQDWLESFAVMVRNQDYSDAERYFDSGTCGFGTIAERYGSLQEYRSLQWELCWSTTKNFTFDLDSVDMRLSNDGTCAIIGVLWTSVGVLKAGEEFARDGRATIVLWRDEATGALKNIHSHYSRTPKRFPEDF